MPLTTIDPTPALIILDLQKGFLGRETLHPLGEIIERSALLATIFRKHSLPVVLVTANGGAPGRTELVAQRGTRPPDFAEVVDELDEQPSDFRVTKQRWGAFYGTPLEEYLRQHGVTQVVLTGVATSRAVESTARTAFENGYNVVLAVDAMTDFDQESHSNSVERIFPRLGETAFTKDIAEMVEASTA